MELRIKVRFIILQVILDMAQVTYLGVIPNYCIQPLTTQNTANMIGPLSLQDVCNFYWKAKTFNASLNCSATINFPYYNQTETVGLIDSLSSSSVSTATKETDLVCGVSVNGYSSQGIATGSSNFSGNFNPYNGSVFYFPTVGWYGSVFAYGENYYIYLAIDIKLNFQNYTFDENVNFFTSYKSVVTNMNVNGNHAEVPNVGTLSVVFPSKTYTCPIHLSYQNIDYANEYDPPISMSGSINYTITVDSVWPYSA